MFNILCTGGYLSSAEPSASKIKYFYSLISMQEPVSLVDNATCNISRMLTELPQLISDLPVEKVPHFVYDLLDQYTVEDKLEEVKHMLIYNNPHFKRDKKELFRSPRPRLRPRTPVPVPHLLPRPRPPAPLGFLKKKGRPKL
jgi:hypothetical protein